MSSPKVTVTTYTRDAPSNDLHALWQATIAKHHDSYSISPPKFHQLLNTDNAKVFVAYAPSTPSSSPGSPSSSASPHKRDKADEQHSPSGPPLKEEEANGDARPHEPLLGFAITYVVKVTASANPDTRVKGSLGALIVSPDHHGQGVGSALHDAAVAYLEGTVRESLPPNTDGTLQLGSTFPRIFPGLPDIEYLRPALDWFRKRGWTVGEPDAIDLYSPLPNDVNFDPFISEARKHGVEFRHARPADREALMRMEFTEFDSFTGWPDLFPKMMSAGKYEDIVLAVRGGTIIGATFAALPPCPLLDQLVWPSTLGKNCGSVACVGVAKAGRGTGAGVGMVGYAFRNLAQRDADGVFVDWVGMKGFYERFGAKQWQAKYCDGSRTVTCAPTQSSADGATGGSASPAAAPVAERDSTEAASAANSREPVPGSQTASPPAATKPADD